jgi:hypothetical protein
MAQDIAAKNVDQPDNAIIITARMWENMQMENAHLKRRLAALEHATGVLRFESDLYDTEEIQERLAEHDFKDVYREIEERVFGTAEDKAVMIYEHLRTEQKKLPRLQVFLLKTKNVKDLFGTKSGDSAIKWMQETAKMYVGKVVLRKVNNGPHGTWEMYLTADEKNSVYTDRT